MYYTNRSPIFVDDEQKLQEELKDLIDDNPIEESDDGSGSDTSSRNKRPRSDDEEELDDRLEDEDYDLIEENLGVKVKRKVTTRTFFRITLTLLFFKYINRFII